MLEGVRVNEMGLPTPGDSIPASTVDAAHRTISSQDSDPELALLVFDRF